ncbi:CDP-diacylglycerol--glycerol-3-phosphate 3-phosphatidyltransferase [Brevibacterium jeotgali]|uniref:CDP-diacylglycerol--glycerol-3-phosphate 3-phosphatidyltransferase n=1 Tax=Brevibacterium jeotgali TaxID=1262550 RepID=A0A2H1L354_9MICO|nr:CDP-diacylglycerol--glycerol-3-phosphate 3-phosphatidyltransferase [Brevibacterium jeotgali]TWC02539.1 CDP-diacylglycerol--glycerol-3-phosphate 3-phosphatidyltransferase [Brevibacterium jeotgali]SMY11331.1 CDP-diacylglycerol--glycerol-3-phosphate 3-phosphatidyltransferase [Brevibacterium jeotgali]
MNDSRETPAPSNWNLPNLLTVVRILLVPVFLVLLVGQGGVDPAWRVGAFAVFIVAMFTDWIDGTLARRWGMITDFGKIADPIADKALMAAALIGLWVVGTLPLWVPIVILVREFGITVLRFVIIRWVVLPASKGGKLKTVLQTLAIGLMLLGIPVLVWVPALFAAWTVVAWIAMTAAIVVTLVTGIDYCVKSYRLVREANGS